MKKIIYVVIALLLIQSVLKSNKYKVTSAIDGVILVERKQDTIKFYDITGTIQAGDSIRLYSDYDNNYKSLINN